MNIVQIYCSYTKGGAELQTFEIAKRLFLGGHKVFLCCPQGSFLYQKAKTENLPVKALNILGSIDLIGIFHLTTIILKEKIEIVHINQGKLFWPGAFLKIIFGKKIKVIFHRRTTIPLKKISYWTLYYADCVIADSVAAKKILLNTGIDEKKVIIIYPGVDLQKFHSGISNKNIQRKYNLNNCFVLGCIANMHLPYGKGQKYLIEAISKLTTKYPEIRLLLVGDGKYRPALELLTKKLNLTDKIIFAGYQKSIEEYIAAMDVLCLPSYGEESFGIVMIEAQAMGKPVIGSAVGGIPETFIPMKTGYLVQPKNTSQLIEVISKLISEPIHLKFLSENCRKWVEENFDIQQTVKKIVQLYSSSCS